MKNANSNHVFMCNKGTPYSWKVRGFASYFSGANTILRHPSQVLKYSLIAYISSLSCFSNHCFYSPVSWFELSRELGLLLLVFPLQVADRQRDALLSAWAALQRGCGTGRRSDWARVIRVLCGILIWLQLPEKRPLCLWNGGLLLPSFLICLVWDGTIIGVLWCRVLLCTVMRCLRLLLY